MLATKRLNHLAGQLVFPARTLGSRALGTDLHLHTTQTDGQSTIDEMLEAASVAGLHAVAFTEHVRRGVPWFVGFGAEVRACAEAYPHLRVLVGLEAKAFDERGGLDADEALISEAEVVLGAFHNYPDGQGGFLPAASLGAEQAAELEFQSLWALLDHPEVDVLAHPGALTAKFFGSFPDALLIALIGKAARNGRAIELNGGYNDSAALARLLGWCKSVDAWVTLGSNAHHASEVGRIGERLKESATYAR